MTKRSDPEGLLIRIREKTTVMPNGCHEYQSWKGSYGLISVKGQLQSVHRLVYTICKGEIPEGRMVRHTCDNPPCCNPEHLLLGTQSENMQDAAERGRIKGWIKGEGGGGGKRGYRNGARRKLTPELATEIRKLRQEGARINALASKYEVSVSAIRDVLDRKTYFYV